MTKHEVKKTPTNVLAAAVKKTREIVATGITLLREIKESFYPCFWCRRKTANLDAEHIHVCNSCTRETTALYRSMGDRYYDEMKRRHPEYAGSAK